MIVSEVSLSTVSSGVTSRSSREQRKCHAGLLILDFGKQAEVDRSGCTVYSRKGRLGSIHETAKMRQDRLNCARRQKGGYRMSWEGSPSQSAGQRSSSSETIPVRPHDRARAAIKIQRAYRAHRAVLILSNFERRILEAVGPARDARTTLSYLRARSAEFAAMRTFMDATPYVSDNARVKKSLQNVSETIRCSIERAEKEERERKAGATVVHAYVSSSSIRSAKKASRSDSMKRANAALSGSGYSSVPASSSTSAAIDGGGIEMSGTKKIVCEAIVTSSTPFHPSVSQNAECVTELASANSSVPRRRYSTVSKIPTLITISEDLESTSA
ncbi:hypothetical protein A7U60_g1392 [Sanghuangporus baumii]|uniref:Uncharacterized protein n=1 Tax=Sanghuangporus baumii TaxID=108892 RepID=A0A9Q5NBA7_SANBA|nr:hypothetical protein A7U60_g1392 [Sanghuangporus baumii]